MSERWAELPRLVTPKRHVDDRGWFTETYHRERLQALGIASDFVQDNQSYSRRAGTLRGFHFQRPPAAQAKLVSVIQGRIVDVAVDIRRGSPSYGRYVSIELSADAGNQLYIPGGFAHGFLSLVDDTIVAYKVSSHYAPDLDDGIRWNDPQIGFSWPWLESAISLSEKDRNLPLLRDFVSPFDYGGNPIGSPAGTSP